MVRSNDFWQPHSRSTADSKRLLPDTGQPLSVKLHINSYGSKMKILSSAQALCETSNFDKNKGFIESRFMLLYCHDLFIDIFKELTQLNVNNSGKIYHCSQYGVTLIIPEGAVQQPTTVWYGACLLSDKFKFEGDYIPVSPIVWIYIDSQLMKPAELYIPHHIDTTNMSERDINDDIFLLAAEDLHQECLNFTQNSTIDVEVNSLFAKIATTHFCSNCIATYGKKYKELPKRYSIARAHKVEEDGTLIVEFIFIYQENGCKMVSLIIINNTQMIEKQCKDSGFTVKEYKEYLPFGQESQDKGVSLLPLEPNPVKGWTIAPSPDQVNVMICYIVLL